MRLRWILAGVGIAMGTMAAAETPGGLVVEHGVYVVHLLLHRVGTEEYSIREFAGGAQELTSVTATSDRGNKRVSTTTLRMGPNLAPERLEETTVRGTGEASTSVATVSSGGATVEEAGVSREMKLPAVAYVGFQTMPAALQMTMMRYWKRHGSPARLVIARADGRALPLEIQMVGHDVFQVKGKMVRLTRYTVANLMFGREILWMNDSGRVAALMTFAGGLPREELLDEYEPVAAELTHSGVEQEMLDLDALDRMVKPERTGAFAIVGARLVDGTGAPAVEHAVVVVRDGRIVASGAVGAVKVPAGMAVEHGEGRTLLPGLWDMHVHESGVEFGPALLAAGITTVRDCGGEFEFLTTLKRKLERDPTALGPRLLLAGLIDSGGTLAFGWVDVRTEAQAVAAVDTYADAGFVQVKVYTQLTPALLKAVAGEAHRRGMTVTGHVPAAMDAFEGIENGMDQINHLEFVTQAMTADAGGTGVDLRSERARRLIALLKERGIVLDPTLSWGEMAEHAKGTPVEAFEPGIGKAPATLAWRYETMGGTMAEARDAEKKMATDLTVISALHAAGVPLVAGSDTGLIGYGLDRELELYVKAGLTPMEAIECATSVAARAMKMEREVGTVEVGKRADLVLVEGNPLADIRDLRRVVSVVKDGRMYDSRALGRLVGFAR